MLVAGSGPVDRDGTVAGIPIFAQLAGALAERGFVVLRYDKRGVGQSGGRTERATLQDYADDVVGGGQMAGEARGRRPSGSSSPATARAAAIAMLAAAREKKIDGVVLIAAHGDDRRAS